MSLATVDRMETDPRVWIDALRRSHDRLQGLVEPLSADQIRSRAYPSEWSIAQVLSHLGSGAQVFESFVDVGLHAGSPPGLDVMQPIWDSWNAKSPDDQAVDALATDEALVKRLESLSPSEIEQFHLSMFGMELDVAGLCRLRVSEHALHTWDVAVALDPTATLDPKSVALLIDTLDMVASRGSNPTGEPLRLQVNTSEPKRSFVLETGDATTLTPGSSNSPDAELLIPAEAFVRLLSGRLDADHTPLVTVQGVDLDHLRAMYPGY